MSTDEKITSKSNKKKKFRKRLASENPVTGWLFISSLCIIAFILDVPLGIILVAIVGYAISTN